MSFDEKYFSKDIIAAGYDLFKAKFFWRKRIDLVKKYCAKGKLLDVGCAYGYFVEYMQKEGFDAYGTDVSKFAVAQSAKNSCGKFAIADAVHFPIKPGQFDVVTLFDVLEHIQDYKTAIKNVLSTLKPGGVFIMQCPLKQETILEHILFDKEETHVSKLSSEENMALLTENNLEILEVYNHTYYLQLINATLLRGNTIAARKLTMVG